MGVVDLVALLRRPRRHRSCYGECPARGHVWCDMRGFTVYPDHALESDGVAVAWQEITAIYAIPVVREGRECVALALHRGETAQPIIITEDTKGFLDVLDLASRQLPSADMAWCPDLSMPGIGFQPTVVFSTSARIDGYRQKCDGLPSPDSVAVRIWLDPTVSAKAIMFALVAVVAICANMVAALHNGRDDRLVGVAVGLIVGSALLAWTGRHLARRSMYVAVDALTGAREELTCEITSLGISLRNWAWSLAIAAVAVLVLHVVS